MRQGLLLAGWMLIAGAAQAQIVPDYRLVYGEVEATTLALDLYLPPATPQPYPLVLWIHGGGWAGGDKYPLPDFVRPLLLEGLAVASLNYRLTGDDRFTTGGRTFPAQIHDVKGAVRYLRAQAATYGLRADRFAAWGSSAGGHLAALLAVSGGVAELEGEVGGNLDQPSALQCAVDYFGPAQLETMGGSHDEPDSRESALIGWDLGDLKANLDNPADPYPELAARLRAAGPINHVDGDDPPLFVAHGTADTSVPFQQSVDFVAALEAAGAPVEWHPVTGAGHDRDQMPSDQARAFLIGILSANDVQPLRWGLYE